MKCVHKLDMGTPVVPAWGRLRQGDLRFLVSLGYNKALCQKKKGGRRCRKKTKRHVYNARI